jgi:hypothetical protein
MKSKETFLKLGAYFFVFPLISLGLVASTAAQTCLTSDELDAATRSAIQNTGSRYFQMISQGDTATLKQNAIPSLANNFTGLENAIKEAQPNLSGGTPAPRPPFELKAEWTAPIPRAEFLCGIFNASGPTANSAEFVIPNLPPGTYAVEILDVNSSKVPYTVSFVFEQMGSDWKLGGLFLRPKQVAGHDSAWFLNRASEFKSQGHALSAWLYYLEGRELAIAVPFMETEASDKLYQQEASMKSPEIPTGGNTVDLAAPDGKIYKLTTVFPLAVGEELDVVVKYQTPSVADTGKTFGDNMTVMKTLAQKYPELRDSFRGIVARGVEPGGRDYGTMMPMKDLK